MRVSFAIAPDAPDEVFAPDCKITVHETLQCHGYEVQVIAFDEASRMITVDVPDHLLGDIKPAEFSFGSRSRSAS